MFIYCISGYRAEVAETLRLATRLNPRCTFEVAASWLQELLQKPVDVGGGKPNLRKFGIFDWKFTVGIWGGRN